MEGIKKGGVPYQVIIADEFMFMAKRLGQFLTSRGFAVTGTAANGAEAVALYKTLYPNVDLVTLDISMPEIDGITALKQILEFDKQAKVVMTGALGDQDIVKKCILNGGQEFHR